jgi:hypothetical protein
MIEILSGVTESMKASKRYLDDLQQASIKAYGKRKNSPHLTQIVEIRQALQAYWRAVANFMADECYETASKVLDLQDTIVPTQLIAVLSELEVLAENFCFKAKALIRQQDVLIEFFGAPNVRLPKGDAMTGFMLACGALRTGLIDLLALIEEQCQACATYQTTIRTNYNPTMLDGFILLGKEWGPYVSKINETWAEIQKLSDDIIVFGVKQLTVSKVGCVIM